VLGFVHQREVAARARPLFIEYALVSSHAPWSVLPPVVDDWSRLEHGDLYRGLSARRYPVRWDQLEEGGQAYLTSLISDFEILGRYLARLPANRDALVIVLGDHQPAGSVTGHDPSAAVPIHVISRSRALVDRFGARGYTTGMIPDRGRAAAGMETFLPELLRALSRDLSGEDAEGRVYRPDLPRRIDDSSIRP